MARPRNGTKLGGAIEIVNGKGGIGEVAQVDCGSKKRIGDVKQNWSLSTQYK